MKIYVHNGDGHWIGSCIVVIALNKNLAEHKIRNLLDRQGLSHEELNIEEIEIIPGRVVVNNNGDY